MNKDYYMMVFIGFVITLFVGMCMDILELKADSYSLYPAVTMIIGLIGAIAVLLKYASIKAKEEK